MPPLPRYRQRIVDPVQGDCFATCVAMILHLSQDEVPNFCSAPGDWWAEFQRWLARYQLYAVEVKLKPRVMSHLAEGALCILSGPSPNFPGVQHSVVAMYERGGFQCLADPNPSDQFLAGEPTEVMFFAPLWPAAVARHAINLNRRVSR